jgi:hypothetical protein
MKYVFRIAVAASAAALVGIHYVPDRRAAPPPVAPAAKPAAAVAPKPEIRKAEPPTTAAVPAAVKVDAPPDAPDPSRLYTLQASQSWRAPGRHGPTPARPLPVE